MATGVLPRWYGTKVTLAWGTSDSVLAMASAVWSCRKRCQKRGYSRRGISTLTSVLPSAAASATTSRAQRLMRRSGHSTTSSGTRARPRRVHSWASSSAATSSVAMCTALSVSGVRVRAYWMARAELWSSRSTSTITEW